MKILTIIVTYNAMQWLDRCIGSLLASTVHTDILVLDNVSTDATVQTLRQHYHQVEVVENGRNLGFGRANNIGLCRALEQDYDYVLLLNQDAWIDADVLQRLTNVSQHHPEYAILSPIHLTGDADKPESGFAHYSGVSDLKHQPADEVVSVPFIDAAIWLMPVNALHRIGLFAPLFYHYGEDKDMCNRVRYHGLLTGYVPRCYGCHDREWRQLSRDRYFRGERTYHLSEYANILHSLLRAFAMGVLAPVKKAAQAALRGHVNDAATYLALAATLLRRSGEVLRTRRQSKRVNLNNYYL